MLAIGGTLVAPIELAHADKIHKQINEEEQYLQADNGVAEQLYADWLTRKIQLEQNKRRAGNQYCNSGGKYIRIEASCVCWVKAQLGLTESVGDARNWRIGTKLDYPVAGSVMVENITRNGHVSLVEKVDETNNTIYIKEANYIPSKVSHRIVNIDSKNIIGFWLP